MPGPPVQGQPFFSYQESVSKLKKQYPEGKVYRHLSGPAAFSYFEYLTQEIYVFSNEQGVFSCDSQALIRVVREAQKGINAREAKDLEDLQSAPKGL